jgi:hypothetical protein
VVSWGTKEVAKNVLKEPGAEGSGKKLKAKQIFHSPFCM